MLDVTCVVPAPIKGQSYDVTHDGSGWRKDVVNQSWEFGFLPPYTSSPRWPLGAAEVYLIPPSPPPPPNLVPSLDRCWQWRNTQRVAGDRLWR